MRTCCLVLGLILGASASTLSGTAWAQTAAEKEKQATVTVVINSDEQTWVSVTNVRQPAKFKSLRLQLAPGVYEIVGRRKGYRDERHTLSVQEGMPPPNVSMICTVNSQGASR